MQAALFFVVCALAVAFGGVLEKETHISEHFWEEYQEPSIDQVKPLKHGAFKPEEVKELLNKRQTAEQDHTAWCFEDQAYTDKFYWGVYATDPATQTDYIYGEVKDMNGVRIGYFYGYSLDNQRLIKLAVDYDGNGNLRQYSMQFNPRNQRYSKGFTTLAHSDINDPPQYLDPPRPAYVQKC